MAVVDTFDIGTFDPVFDADTGWAIARARRTEVIERWRTEGRQCIMRGCEHRAIDRLCRGHLAKITRRWIPVTVTDEELRCGLCRTLLMWLHRNDQPKHVRWFLEATGHLDGTCRVEEGGFTVLTADEAHRHRGWTEAPPLFRSHPAVCPEVVRLRDAGVVGWVSGE